MGIAAMSERGVDERPARPRRWRRRWIAGGALAAIAAGLWLARVPIADNFIQDQLDSRGVPARYVIETIGLRTQRLTDIVIGDPRRPDLTARAVEVTMGYGLSGPYVAHLRAEGVRLHGRFADGRLSLGALDKFRDPASTDPFALPDLTVRLDDARARIETPWGAIGAALTGRGNLRSDFTGKLALLSRRITVADCAADQVRFYGDLSVRDVRPTLAGPLRGHGLRCANGFAAAAPEIALDLSLSEDLRQWKGQADARIAALSAGSLAADRLGLLARFEGTAERTVVDLDVEAARVRAADVMAETVGLTGKGLVGAKAPTFDGRLSFARAAEGTGLRRAIVEGASGAQGTPVGPLASKAAEALARMLADMEGEAGIALAGEGASSRIELIAPQVTGASGARFSGGDGSRIAYLFGAARPAVTIAGRWSFGGGGLPSGDIDLERRADGAVSGLATLAAYDAGSARLALTPVRFSGGPGALLRFATVAELSGPVGDGRVERLSVPLRGAVAPTGALALDGGCSRIAAERVEVSGFRLARPVLDLCSRPGAPLLVAGPSGLAGHVRIPRLALRGTSGGSPVAFDSGPGEIDLAAMRWTLAGADVRFGEGEGVTHFAADRIAGRSDKAGMAGELTGASGKIGAVPLTMSEIGGQWRWAKGALTLAGGLVLTDAEPDARFHPLVSRDAKLRFADGVIDAVAPFHEQRTGKKILDAVITHRLGDSSGSADLLVRELRFDETFQPDQLTRLALGVVANVRGSVVGDGRIEWTADGVTSRGTFATADADLAAAFGPVSGLTTTLSFDDLIALRTAPGQVARIVEVNPGIPVLDGQIEYRLLGDNRVRVEGGSWPFGGGQIVLHPATLDFNAAEPRRLSFDIVGVDAAVFLQQFGFENINATGTFDGTLPVEFGGLGGRIVDGRIDSRGGGGTLAYVGELSNRNLGMIANFAFGALSSLKYDDLMIVLNGDLDGEMVTDIRFGGVGQGDGATRNFLTSRIAKLPLVFNIKISAPFRQLLTSAKGFYDPTLLIEQNLPTLLRAQEEAEAAAKAASRPVQPTESEPMP
jgi:hypothetical protein